MRILHISDTHGEFPKLIGKFDIIVHSGDMLEEEDHFKDHKSMADFQLNWVKSNISNFKSWIKNKPFLMIPGNHDYLDYSILENELNFNNINAINLMNKLVNVNDFNFYGFPYVPYINGSFMYEARIDTMRSKVKVLESKIDQIDVLVAHSAMYDILDKGNVGQNYGSPVIKDMFCTTAKLPKAYLHGHVHESNGFTMLDTMLVSNAATTQNIIEL